MLKRLSYIFVAATMSFLSACGGGSGASTYTVGGTVSGLAVGKSLQMDLVTDGHSGSGPGLSDSRTVTVNGAFTFGPQIASGSTYTVSVSTQPYGQMCSVTNHTGTLNSDVSNVNITCVDKGLYVFSTNEAAATVATYAIDPATGALARVGTPVTTNTTLPSAEYPAPKSIAVHPTGRYAYVTNEGANSIVQYTINSSIGTLSNAVTTTGFNAIKDIAIHPAGTYAYVGGQVGTTLGIYSLSVNASTGALSSPTFAGQLAWPDSGAYTDYTVDRLVFNPSGNFLYAANQWNGNVSAFAVDSTGHLTFKNATSSKQYQNNSSCGSASDDASFINWMTVDPSGKFMYLASGDYLAAGGITAFSLNTSTDTASGTFTQVGCMVATGGPVKSVVVDPTGKYLYAINGSSQSSMDTAPNKLLAFSINGATGALTAIGSPLATGVAPAGMTIDRGGKYVYVTNSGDNTISTYSINAATGNLTLVGSPTSTGSGTQPQAIGSY